jgi:ATP-dependent DNA ligase
MAIHVGQDDVGQPTCRVQSRRGADLTTSFPDLALAAAEQLPMDTVLDGEAVIWSGDRLDFTALQHRLAGSARAARLAQTQPASFVAFDVLALGGEVWTDRPLRDRRRQLDQLLPTLAPPLQVNPATRDPDIAAEWLRQYQEVDVGIEGLVIKGLGEPYRGTRTWLKLRTRSTADAIVGAVTCTLARPDRLVLGLYDRRRSCSAGSCASSPGRGPARACR